MHGHVQAANAKDRKERKSRAYRHIERAIVLAITFPATYCDAPRQR